MIVTKAMLIFGGMVMTQSLQTVLAEDWIGLEEPPTTHAGYAYRHDEDGSDGHRLYLYQQFTRTLNLQLDWGRNTLEDGSTRFDSELFSGGLDWSISDTFGIGGGYRFDGEANELEIERYVLSVNYAPLPLSFTLEASQGTVAIFTRPEINRPNIPYRTETDVDTVLASIGWSGDFWSAYLSVEEYDYQRDLSALATRPLLQLLVKPGVLANSGLLLQRQAGIGATFYQQTRDLTARYSLSTSAIDNSDSEELSFDWREYHGDFDMIYGLGYAIDSDQPWSLGIGLEWHA